MQEEKLKDKFEPGDKVAIEMAAHAALDWLDENKGAEKNDFAAKLRDVEGIVTPIMARTRNRR